MSSKTTKGIIFDLDGTLLDTLGDLTLAINRTAAEYHQPLLTRQQVSDNIGNGFKVTVTKSLPGVDAGELLVELSKRNIRLAVVSNKVHDYVVKLITTRFPQTEFDLIYGEDDTRKRKPDPQGLL